MSYCIPDYIQWVAPMLVDIADAAAEVMCTSYWRVWSLLLW